jgi:hypothetical protein
MTRDSERQAWTAFVEQREAARKKKRVRPKKDPLPAREELERALDSLSKEQKP